MHGLIHSEAFPILSSLVSARQSFTVAAVIANFKQERLRRVSVSSPLIAYLYTKNSNQYFVTKETSISGVSVANRSE